MVAEGPNPHPAIYLRSKGLAVHNQALNRASAQSGRQFAPACLIVILLGFGLRDTGTTE
jgi:hypothetical protein